MRIGRDRRGIGKVYSIAVLKSIVLVTVAISVIVALYAITAKAQDSLTLLAELWGEKEKDYFVICASAGDVNGDGYMDIIVGAVQDPLHEPGYVKIYLGGEDFDTTPELKMVGEDKGPIGKYSGFGVSVACAGDVNRDGYDDVIVGARYAFNYDNWTWNAGKAYVYFGGNPMDTTADVILKDSDYNWHYGHSVSSAGDVNADGYDDVMVGAPNDYYDGRGRAFIYFGGENMDNVFDVYIEGTPMKAEELGRSVTGIGDLDGDGYDDVLIGAPHTGGWPHPIGRASVYFGGDPMDTTADVIFRGDSIEFLNFGRVVASAGDANGDGINAIAVGGVSYRVGLFNSVSGSPELKFDTLTLLGEEILPSAFGLSISTAGDLNGDSFDDVIVGDYQYGEDLKGKVYLFYGGNPMDSLFDLTLVGDDLAGSRFGYRLAFAGDVNGDGYGEILVSSYGDSTRRGKIFVYTSKPTSVDENQRSLNPRRFFLGQNYPNPFNSATTISFTVDSKQKTVHGESQVKLTVYNILGQKVKLLVDEKKPPGYYEVAWDGKNDSGKEVASGVYFYHLKTENYSQTRKILLLK